MQQCGEGRPRSNMSMSEDAPSIWSGAANPRGPNSSSIWSGAANPCGPNSSSEEAMMTEAPGAVPVLRALCPWLELAIPSRQGNFKLHDNSLRHDPGLPVLN
jgi:hypothetical protein